MCVPCCVLLGHKHVVWRKQTRFIVIFLFSLSFFSLLSLCLKKTFLVVTGATDGLGKAYAEEVHSTITFLLLFFFSLIHRWTHLFSLFGLSLSLNYSLPNAGSMLCSSAARSSNCKPSPKISVNNSIINHRFIWRCLTAQRPLTSELMDRAAVWSQDACHWRRFHWRTRDLRHDRRTAAGSRRGRLGQQRGNVLRPSWIPGQHSRWRGVLHAPHALQHSVGDGHDPAPPPQDGGETQRTHSQCFIRFSRPSNTAPLHVFQL